MKRKYNWIGGKFRFCSVLIALIALVGCTNGGNSSKSPSPPNHAQTLLGSFQANVTLDPPSISIEPINSSGIKTQGLAITDLVDTKYPFQIKGSLSFSASTATISVKITNTSSSATLKNVDVRIRSITDLGISILGDTPAEPVPDGTVPGGYFLIGIVDQWGGIADDSWVFNNVSADYRFWFDVYGDPVTKTTGYIVGSSVVLKSTDAGETWTATANFGDNSLNFPADSETGYVASTTLHKTTNGGDSWTNIFPTYNPSPPASWVIKGIRFSSDTLTGIQIQELGSYIYRTTDGGMNMVGTSINCSPGTCYYYWAHTDCSLKTWVVGYIDSATCQMGMVWSTTTWGASWSIILQSTCMAFRSIYFRPNNLIGYAVGWYRDRTCCVGRVDGPVMFKSTDGGTSWNELTWWPWPSTWQLYGVSFTSDSTGYVVGNSGIIFKTTDGGLTWTQKGIGVTTANLNAVYFLDDNTGVAVGDSGTILKTSDAGETWVIKGAGVTTSTLYDVQFP